MYHHSSRIATSLTLEGFQQEGTSLFEGNSIQEIVRDFGHSRTWVFLARI
jgi:hypothetical protein